MSNLASLTQAAHRNAERQEFAREMMSGNMSNEKYKTYLYNMWLVYDQNRYLGLGTIPKPKLTDTFGPIP